MLINLSFRGTNNIQSVFKMSIQKFTTNSWGKQYNDST